MSHATHVGFRAPPTADGNVGSPELPRWLGPPFVPSVALGVGHIMTAVASPSPLVAEAPLRLWLPFTLGVGQRCTARPK
jgi:hypothetical protein